MGERGTQKTTGRWICLHMIQFGNINESLPRDLPICFSVGMATTIPETHLALESENRPSQKETSFTTPIFQGTCSFSGGPLVAGNPHPQTWRLFEEIDGLEPGTWHHLCLGNESLLFPNSLKVDLFFLGGGEDSHGKINSKIHPMFFEWGDL